MDSVLCKCSKCIKAVVGLYSVWHELVTPRNYGLFIKQTIQKNYIVVAYGSKQFH